MAEVVRQLGLLQRARAVSARFLLGEAAGALGDLGTFVPIVVGMTQIVGLDAATVLVSAGLMNILTGAAFGIPIPVQPMKAIAALAIAGAMTAPQVGMAGMTAGALMLLMGALGLISWLDRVVPRAPLRGLQMAVAAHLAVAGIRLSLYGHQGSGLRAFWGADGLLLAAVALGLVVVLYRRPLWMALGLVALGLAGALLKEPSLLQGVRVTLWRPAWVLWDSSALSGIWLGGLPQIPLTLLNSVLAVSVLAGHLFPDSRRATRPARIAISVGLMNLLACPLGGMPVCHGSGGLAGQHRFGARTGTSMVMLGSAKLLVGLLLGGVALAWMRAFPSSVLGVFLVVAGAALARASCCWTTRQSLVVAAVTVAVHLASGLLLLGFAAGWAAHLLLPKEQDPPQATPTEAGRSGVPDAR